MPEMKLGVNIDHVATIRQARKGKFPDPVEAALLCQRAGATSIVCHLREDRRHIQDHDIRRLKSALRIPLNLEMSIAPSVVATALRVIPAQVTLVPERRQELTTEGGLNIAAITRQLQRLLKQFIRKGIAVSVFIDPEPKQIYAARDLGIPIVELHTGGYANRSGNARSRAVRTITAAAHHAHQAGFMVAAGHGLDYDNVKPIAKIPHIEELNIGFSIISRALWVGLPTAVKEMRRLIT